MTHTAPVPARPSSRQVPTVATLDVLRLCEDACMVIEVFVRVAAPAARVWQVLADPEHMPDLSPELDRIEWIGVPEPDVGGSHRGHNRFGLFR